MLPTREKRERMLGCRLAWAGGAGLDRSVGGGPPRDDAADVCVKLGAGAGLPLQASLALLLRRCCSTCSYARHVKSGGPKGASQGSNLKVPLMLLL